MFQHRSFIDQNVAPPETTVIGMYNKQGLRVGFIPLDSLAFPNAGKKLFSFAALSDVHIVYETAADDFRKALTYANDEKDVAFTIISGDLTDNGTEDQFEQYANIVAECSSDTPVYAIAGNHERYDVEGYKHLETYTGHPLYYSFEHENVVFVMCGCYSWSNGNVFTNESLQWLYETLEANRNKRCVVIQHVLPGGDSGNACNLYNSFDNLDGTKGQVFLSLLRHYKNTVLFSGHSHLKFYLQELDPKANYSEAAGYKSVHIPSLAMPRDITNGSLSDIYADSEGYIVDVYENGLHLQGRDFVKEEFLPIASYWIDTNIQEVEANTYVDSSGIINTNI